MGRAYYNEIDRDAAHVLRCLIADGLIAPGDVDDRSIKDVQPDDLAGYTQAHFFAGAGLWSVAARLAGWPDDRPLWTGSCPCQPFSAAGKGAGINDPRHLWPDFFRLIRSCRPPVVMGEQVAGSPGYGWFDGVRADLEGEDFASRVVDIPVCAVDGPHIRQRLWWCAVANADRPRSTSHGRDAGEVSGLSASQCRAEDNATLPRGGYSAPFDRLADTDARGCTGRQEASQRGEIERTVDERPAVCVGNAERGGCDRARLSDGAGQEILVAAGPDGRAKISAAIDLAQPERGGREGRNADRGRSGATHAPNRPNGSAWAGADWLVCHDGKARRTEPGICLLVDGMAGRVPAWRLAGNSISPVLAAEVIGAYLDSERVTA